MDIMVFLRDNFAHVAPILAAGFIAIAIILERLRALFIVYPIRDRKTFFDRIRGLVMSDRLVDAVALCNAYGRSPIAQVVKEGIMRAHQPEEMLADGLQLAVGEVSQEVQRRTAFLATIANVATLLGLFGTIAGLIHSFQAIGSADPQQKSVLLAAGISTAMNATMLGLGVAIPCMVAFSFLMNKTNRLSAEIEHSAIRTLDILRARYYHQGEAQQARIAQLSQRSQRYA
jgi:biopolymer transport protein ExbB/TolQ